MTTLEGSRLIEADQVPVIYADIIGRVTLCAPNVRLVYVEQRFIGEERVLWPVVEIVRPIVGCEQDWLRRAVERYRPVMQVIAAVH